MSSTQPELHALHAERERSRMRRRRGVSTAVATGSQRLEFVRIVCHPMSSTKLGRVALHVERERRRMRPRQLAPPAPETVSPARVSAKSVLLTRSRALVGYHAPTKVALRAWTAPIVKRASMVDVYAPLGRTTRRLAESRATSTRSTRSSQRTPKNRACRVGRASIAKGTLQFLLEGMCDSMQ